MPRFPLQGYPRYIELVPDYLPLPQRLLESLDAHPTDRALLYRTDAGTWLGVRLMLSGFSTTR